MSYEQGDHGRDDAPADGSRTDAHHVPAYAYSAAHSGGASAGTAEADAEGHSTSSPRPGPHGSGPLPGPASLGPAGPGWPPAAPHDPFPHTYGPPPTAVGERPRASRTMSAIVATALIAGLVGGGAGFGGAYLVLGDGTSTTRLTSSPASTAVANTVPGSVAAAAATATPSTVDIRVTAGRGSAEGSGVILTADGFVLTNNHVVAGSPGEITVTLADGSEHRATVVGAAPSYDLAVLKIEGVSDLTPATLGRSSDVQVGQQVVAIGSPQGLTGTVTTGIISALNRTVQVSGEDGSGVVYNGLQTDTPINPGNSGGPLVNLDGQVVGINSAIATGSQGSGSIGLGFAIPVDQARRVAQEIMDTGTATKPVLGVQGDLTAGNGAGALLAAVEEGSPAAAAGLAPGDVVTKVGQAKVEDFADLVARVGSHTPGGQVTLTVRSGGAERTVEVTLGSQPDRTASTGAGGN